MKDEEIEFKRERLLAHRRISRQCLTSPKVSTDYVKDDIVKDLVTLTVETSIYFNLADERTIHHNFGKPSFLDWLLGRERKVSIEVKVKDLLLNPPPNIDTARIYLIDKADNEL